MTNVIKFPGGQRVKEILLERDTRVFGRDLSSKTIFITVTIILVFLGAVAWSQYQSQLVPSDSDGVYGLDD